MSGHDVAAGSGGAGGHLPPGVPPQQPLQGPRETRGVAFFVAAFLGILLLASAGLNVLLLLLSLGSLAGAGLGATAEGVFDEVHVAGPRTAAVKILSVPIHGAISQEANPLLGSAGGIVARVERALADAGANDDIRGVLLDIDSPGGGVTDSDRIYTAVRRFRRDHPDKRVLALFGDMAASGGYYVAAAAERIFARRTSITGSIGVIMSGYNFAEAAKKIGVDSVSIKSDRTPFKDILSPTRPMRDDERALLTRIVDELYDQFVEVVDEGRDGMDREQVLAVATGAIYTASQAVANGLVDEIGDREAVLHWFERELGSKVALVEQRRRLGLAEVLLGASAPSRSLEQSAGRLLTGLSGPRFLYFWEGGR
ncbi:MAG: signal peptide peptidase SppA [Planctomycetes bacterium]|nr:signal peptide peptidase SppA [Planctomycetota bacterium]